VPKSARSLKRSAAEFRIPSSGTSGCSNFRPSA
jgi:hypothetical protein